MDDEIGSLSHWVPDLVSRVGVTAIPIHCPLLQAVEQEQSSKMITTNEIKQASQSYLESMQREFYLTGVKEPNLYGTNIHSNEISIVLEEAHVLLLLLLLF